MVDTQIYILNPDYYFKNDVHRMILYSTNRVQPYSAKGWVSYVHPVQAQILFSFVKPYPMSWHYEDLKSKFHLSPAQVDKMIGQYIENEEAVYTEFGNTRISFPKNVLLPYEKVKIAYLGNRNEGVNFSCRELNLEAGRLLKGPHSMTLMLTSRCMTNCRYCYADRKTSYKPLSTEEIFRIIDEAWAMDMSHIDIIGGEVFCHRDWAKIIKKLVDCELMPSYISTKVPLAESQIKALKETGYDNVVQISLDSLDDKVLAQIIGSKSGYVEQMKKTIGLLEKYGFQIQIDTILTKYNCNTQTMSDLFVYIGTLRNLSYWEIRVPELSLYTPDSFVSVKADRTSIENLRSFVQEQIMPKACFTLFLSDNALDYSVYKGGRDEKCFKGGACGALLSSMFVLPDGKVSICELMYWNPQFLIGDLRQQSISEVWNSSKALSIYNHTLGARKESRCSSCKVLDFCQENKRKCVVKVIQAYGRDNWDYPDPRCEFAPEICSEMKY